MDSDVKSSRRLFVARGVAAGAGVAGLALIDRAAWAQDATPVPPVGPRAGCDPLAGLPKAASFTVTSTDVRDGEPMPKAQYNKIFGAGGEDISPQLSWSGFPSGTQSFCVTMYDPDAATGSGFWHWAVVDIPASATELASGAGAPGDAKLPKGAFQLRNDASLAQYIGAGPPVGDPPHRYVIVVHAVGAPTVGVDKNATPAFLGFMLGAHILGRAVIIPTAQRTS